MTLDIDDLSGMLASRKYFQECLQLGTVQEGAVEKLKSMLEESIRKEAENREYHIRKQEFKITTGYNFEKFDIVDYKDIISAEVVLGTGIFSELNAQISDLFGTKASEFEGKIAIAKSKAMENLKHKALNRGTNAIIGVDFDLMTLSNNMIVVPVNGTAVKIEKSN